jgi:hypothetical protein
LKQQLEIALREQARLSEGRIDETKAEIAERLQLEQPLLLARLILLRQQKQQKQQKFLQR